MFLLRINLLGAYYIHVATNYPGMSVRYEIRFLHTSAHRGILAAAREAQHINTRLLQHV